MTYHLSFKPNSLLIVKSCEEEIKSIIGQGYH